MEQQLATTVNATAIYQRMNDPMDAVIKMGKMFASSGMFGCQKEEQGQVLALACMVQGKDPFELMQNYYIINGSLSMKSVAVLANFMKAGGKVKWHSALNDVEQAIADFEIGDNRLEKAIYNIEDAQREGLIAGPNKHNWTVRPAEMLRARLITKAVRMIAPGIIMGAAEETDATPPMATPAPLLEKTTKTATIEAVPDLTLEEMLTADGITEEQAIAFLKTRKLLEDGGTLKDLTKAHRGRVTKNYEDFKLRVREYTKEQEGEPK